MRTAVITYCLGYNYGAMLQCFATVKALEGLGHEVRLINYHHPWSFGLDPRDWHNYVSRNPRVIYHKLKTLWKQRNLRKCFSPMWTLWPLTEYYGTKSDFLVARPPECDCLITGSDQTWNTSASRELFAPYFLNFGDENVKRVSYAASTGNVKFREGDINWIVGRLKKYSAISVREKGDVAYLKSLGIDNVVQMPDPTMIVPRSIYDELILNETHKRHDAVIYLLGGDKILEFQNIIPQILKKNGLNISNSININLQSFQCKRIKNRLLTVPGWVDAIANAGIVITNSFHAVVFSLIYGTPFIFVKFTGNKAGANARIESLLDGTGETFRMVELRENFDLLPYMRTPDFNDKIVEFRTKGIGFLTQELGKESNDY